MADPRIDRRGGGGVDFCKILYTTLLPKICSRGVREHAPRKMLKSKALNDAFLSNIGVFCSGTLNGGGGGVQTSIFADIFSKIKHM